MQLTRKAPSQATQPFRLFGFGCIRILAGLVFRLVHCWVRDGVHLIHVEGQVFGDGLVRLLGHGRVGRFDQLDREVGSLECQSGRQTPNPSSQEDREAQAPRPRLKQRGQHRFNFASDCYIQVPIKLVGLPLKPGAVKALNPQGANMTVLKRICSARHGARKTVPVLACAYDVGFDVSRAWQQARARQGYSVLHRRRRMYRLSYSCVERQLIAGASVLMASMLARTHSAKAETMHSGYMNK